MNASDAAWLHERTKHTWQRLHTESHSLDWGNHPFPFKLYPDLEPLPSWMSEITQGVGRGILDSCREQGLRTIG
jgi:hypothetical protein